MGSTEEKQEKTEIAIQNGKEEEIPQYEQDEGWAWVVLIGAFLTMMVGHLPLLCFSLMYEPIFTSNNVSNTQIAWINGLLSLVWNFVILFLGPLCDEFGWRKVGMTAAAINALGVLLSAWIPTPSVLYFYVSILGGIGGTSLASVCFFVVPHYFQKKRGLAMAVNSIGTCVALIAGPPLAVVLIDYFGSKWSFLIFGVFLLNGIPFTSVFHPLEWHKKAPPKRKTQSSGSEAPVEEKLLKKKRVSVQKPSLSSKLIAVLKGTFGSFYLVRERKVLHICFSKCFIYMGYITFQMWITFAVMDRGFSRETASFCMTAAGVGNIVGRLFVAFFSDCACVNKLTMFKAGILFVSLSILGFAFSATLLMLAFFVSLWGFSMGVTMSLYHLSIIEVVGLKLFPRTFGIASLFAGAFLCILGPLIGLVKDYTPTFTIPLSLISACVAVAFILWVTLPDEKIVDPKSLEEKQEVVQ